MELWLCAFQRRGELMKWEMEAVLVGWSTSAITHFIPARKGEEPPGPGNNPLC